MAAGRNQFTQTQLPFGDAEAAHAERWNDLTLALLRLPLKQCTAHLAGLMRWIYNANKLGKPLTKSHAELAARPWGLCCDERTVRRIVACAKEYGLIICEEQRRWDGSQQPNSYWVDWDGVAALKNGRSTGGHYALAPGHSVHPGGHSVQGGGHHVRHIRNNSTVQCSTVNSGSGPEAEPNPRSDSALKSQTLAVKVCDDAPILAAARERRVAPLPPGDLLYGVFAAIEERHIREPLGFVTWHRMQLGTPEPVMGDTEADLLLTLAAALYAASLRREEIRKNRVAIFVNAISHHAFLRCLPFVPKARSLLDQGITERGSGWAGLAVEPERAIPTEDAGFAMESQPVEANEAVAETCIDRTPIGLECVAAMKRSVLSQ